MPAAMETPRIKHGWGATNHQLTAAIEIRKHADPMELSHHRPSPDRDLESAAAVVLDGRRDRGEPQQEHRLPGAAFRGGASLQTERRLIFRHTPPSRSVRVCQGHPPKAGVK